MKNWKKKAKKQKYAIVQAKPQDKKVEEKLTKKPEQIEDVWAED